MSRAITKVAVVSLGGIANHLIDILRDGFLRLLGPKNVCCIYDNENPEGHLWNRNLHSFLYETKSEFDGSLENDVELVVADIRNGMEKITWAKSAGKLVAVVDGEDDDLIRPEFLPLCDVYFKREMFPDRVYDEKVRPLVFAAVPEPMEAPERVYKGLFMGSCFGYKDREKYRDAVIRNGFLWVGYRIPRSEYLHLLQRSMIGVSLKGAGWDTYRFWETAYHGAYLMAEKPQTIIGRAFDENLGEASYFSSPEEFEQKVVWLLGRWAELEERRKRCQIACLDYNLSFHRAKQVLSVMGEI